MTVLPSCALSGDALAGGREVTGYQRLRAQHRSATGTRELETQLQILDDMAGRKIRLRQRCPRERHSRPHQLAWKSESMEPYRPHLVLYEPSELRNARRRFSAGFRLHQIHSLDGPPTLTTGSNQKIDRARAGLAIGIEDQNDVRRTGLEMT